MCDVNKIASWLTAASIAIIAAVAIYVLVAVFGASYWTSLTNIVLMLIAAGILAGAIGFVAAALVEARKCTSGRCPTAGLALQRALSVLATTLTVLLASGIAAALASGVPGVGTAIGIFFAASAVAAGIALIVISESLLPALDACLGTASSAVAAQRIAGWIAGLALIFAAAVGGGVTIKTGAPFPPLPPLG